MAYGLRAWSAAGHYPGTLLSPRTEKHTVTTDRFGDRVETKQVADAYAGTAAERVVTDRFGDHLRESSVVDPISGQTQTIRVRSESPRGLRRHHWEDAFADPLYRGRVGLSRAALDDPLVGDYRRSALDDPLYRRAALDDPLYRRSALDDPLYRRSALDDPLYRRNGLDGRLYGRSALDDRLYGRSALDDRLYGRTGFDDRLYGRTALDDPLYGGSALVDPLYRRSVDPLYNDGLLDRRTYLADPLYADPLYRRSSLDDPNWRLSSRNFAARDPLHRRSVYDDSGFARRSANLDSTLLNRECMYDLDNVTWSRSAFRNPLTGTLA